jgi:putative ABC transport system permease protein
MRKVTLRGLLAHKLRLALTALAIVLGVTFISGTFVLTDTLNSTFSNLFTSVYSKIDFQVRGVAQFGSGAGATRNPVPESLLARVRSAPGVGGTYGEVQGYAQFIARDGKPISSTTGMLGVGARSPSTTRSRSSSASGRGNSPCYGSSVPVEGKYCAPCSPRRRSSASCRPPSGWALASPPPSDSRRC